MIIFHPSGRGRRAAAGSRAGRRAARACRAAIADVRARWRRTCHFHRRVARRPDLRRGARRGRAGARRRDRVRQRRRSAAQSGRRATPGRGRVVRRAPRCDQQPLLVRHRRGRSGRSVARAAATAQRQRAAALARGAGRLRRRRAARQASAWHSTWTRRSTSPWPHSLPAPRAGWSTLPAPAAGPCRASTSCAGSQPTRTLSCSCSGAAARRRCAGSSATSAAASGSWPRSAACARRRRLRSAARPTDRNAAARPARDARTAARRPRPERPWRRSSASSADGAIIDSRVLLAHRLGARRGGLAVGRTTASRATSCGPMRSTTRGSRADPGRGRCSAADPARRPRSSARACPSC